MSEHSGVTTSVADGRGRCWWCGDDPLYVAYHDTEWGRPVRDDRALFEKLCLEGFQAGLAWITVLRKRDAFRRAFRDFHPASVAGFGDDEVNELLADPGIIRHRGKIEATIANARAMMRDFPAPGDFTEFIWGFAPAPRTAPTTMSQIPAVTPESTALSRDLRRRGWRFVGPTTAYAFMQSMGLVNDHLTGCEFAASG